MILTSSDPAGTTPFFIPGVLSDGEERELERLRKCAAAMTGCIPGTRRIQRLSCRIGGRDCVVAVGEPDPVDGAAVLAIIELGRHLPYGVFTDACADEPTLLVGPSVYSVTEFGRTRA